MKRLIKNWDVNGKPITFYYMTSSIHKTIFGGLLSVFSFSLMLSITLTTLLNFIYQKPNISSNIVFYINKRFMYLENLEIKGAIRSDNNDQPDQLKTFLKYFRVVFFEKNEFNSIDDLHVAKLHMLNDMSFSFKFTTPINDVFKDNAFSVLKIIPCKELKKIDSAKWQDDADKETCFDDYDDYFDTKYSINFFTFSFDTPIYSIDKKGNIQKTNHENEVSFLVEKNKHCFYSMEAKFVVIEDNSSLIFTSKRYEAYIVLKNPELSMKEKSTEGYTLDIGLENKSSEEVILITIYKYKLLDFLAKLGGIMKIVTFMKMTCRFWSSYLYEKSLYNLVVSRKNKYLEEKRAIIELSYNVPINSTNSSNLNSNININSNKADNVSVKSRESPKSTPVIHYTSYCAWFCNRFCKCFYINKEAIQKRRMLCEILGLDNYLLHLDYIDRQILLENQSLNNIVQTPLGNVLNNNLNLNIGFDEIKNPNQIQSNNSNTTEQKYEYIKLESET